MGDKPSAIPAFVATSSEEIDGRVETLRSTFRSNRTKDVQFRLVQLRKLYWAIVDNTALIVESLAKDMRKSEIEAHITEINWVKTECLNLANNLEKWLKDEPVKNAPLTTWFMRPRIHHEPLGLIFIITAFNYPYMLGISAAAGAIAAGNCVVLKPSEGSPHSAMVIKKIFDDALDPECYVCVNGAVPETQHLLDVKWDKIHFTGGTAVGKIVAQKAAETLTPVILELGGRNPGFVTKNANIKLAAKRILFQKCLNAGQICLSTNYVLVERSVLGEFIGELKKSLQAFFPDGVKASNDYSRIVNKRYFDRMKAMVDNSKGKLILGGSTDESELFIEPTVVLVDDINDSMMVEESFGPVWSIMAWDTLDEAIEIANKVDPTPLSLITFGADAENQKVLQNVTSGGATCNDSFFHAQFPESPLGGVGTSGQGSYHGYYSIKAFSHERVIASVPYWVDVLLRVRYMPYSAADVERFQKMALPKPNFDRDGNVVKGLGYWLRFIFSFGTSSPQRSVENTNGVTNGASH